MYVYIKMMFTKRTKSTCLDEMHYVCVVMSNHGLVDPDRPPMSHEKSRVTLKHGLRRSTKVDTYSVLRFIVALRGKY